MTQGQNGYEIPHEMRDMAQKGVEQARKAVGGFMGAAHKTVDNLEGSSSVVHSSATDILKKNLAWAEQYFFSVFDLAQKIVSAKNLQEFTQYQTEFMKQQMSSIQSHLQDVSVSVQKTTSDVTQANRPQ